MNGTLRQRGPNSWEIQIFWGRDSDGKEIRQTETVRGKKSDADRRRSRVPRGGVTGTGWHEESHRVILDGSDKPNKEYDGGQEQHGPFGTTAQARHGRRCGLSAGSPAGAGGGHHSLPRAPTRGTLRCRRRSAPSMVNATRIVSPTATVIAVAIGTLG